MNDPKVETTAALREALDDDLLEDVEEVVDMSREELVETAFCMARISVRIGEPLAAWAVKVLLEELNPGGREDLRDEAGAAKPEWNQQVVSHRYTLVIGEQTLGAICLNAPWWLWTSRDGHGGKASTMDEAKVELLRHVWGDYRVGYSHVPTSAWTRVDLDKIIREALLALRNTEENPTPEARCRCAADVLMFYTRRTEPTVRLPLVSPGEATPPPTTDTEEPDLPPVDGEPQASFYGPQATSPLPRKVVS
jgi:hypothetical protein